MIQQQRGFYEYNFYQQSIFKNDSNDSRTLIKFSIISQSILYIFHKNFNFIPLK